MNTRYFYAVLACLALLVAIPTAIRSQNVVTGQVNGAVVDTTGAAVANARVTLENIATGAEEQPIHTTLHRPEIQTALRTPPPMAPWPASTDFRKLPISLIAFCRTSGTMPLQFRRGCLSRNTRMDDRPMD